MKKSKYLIILIIILVLIVSCQRLDNNEVTTEIDEEHTISISGKELITDETIKAHAGLTGAVLIDVEYSGEQEYMLSIEIWRDGSFERSVGNISEISNEVNSISISGNPPKTQNTDEDYIIEYTIGIHEDNGSSTYNKQLILDGRYGIAWNYENKVKYYSDTDDLYLWIMRFSNDGINSTGSIQEMLLNSEYAAVVILKPIN